MESIAFRRDGVRRAWIVIYSLMAAVWLVVAALNWDPLNVAGSLVLLISFAGLALATAWIARNVARSGVFADEEGVTFRNWFRVRTVPWERVVRFERPAPNVGLRSGLAVRLTDGSAIRSDLYGGTGLFKSPKWADGVVLTLNAALLDRVRCDGRMPGASNPIGPTLPAELHLRALVNGKALPGGWFCVDLPMQRKNSYRLLFGPASPEGSLTITEHDIVREVEKIRNLFLMDYVDLRAEWTGVVDIYPLDRSGIANALLGYDTYRHTDVYPMDYSEMLTRLDTTLGDHQGEELTVSADTSANAGSEVRTSPRRVD